MFQLDSNQRKILNKLDEILKNPIARIHIEFKNNIGFNLKSGAYISDGDVVIIALHKKYLLDFPDVLCNLKSLKRLYLFNNKITEIPKSIGNLNSLEIFNLRDNKLKRLPETIGDLTLLKQLILKENELENLPISFGKLINLEKLDLSKNNLSNLPETFNNLKLLRILDLNKNSFNNLPYSVWSVINNLEIIEWEDNPWNDESKTILKRDLPAIAEYCRERASIKVFLCHKYEEYKYFKIKQIAENMKQKDEVYEVHYCEKDAIVDIDKYMEETISKCHLLIFFASIKSMKSDDCIIELKYAQNKGINIIPIIKESDGLDREKLENFGTNKNKINLGRPISFFYDEKDIENLFNDIYTQIKKIKRKHNFFERYEDSDIESPEREDLDYFNLNGESFPKPSLEEYENKTGKHAIWRGKFTKGFKNWFNDNYG